MNISQPESSFFEQNRKNLISILPGGSLAIFNSNDEYPRNGDQCFPFRQNSDLYYLTGIDQEMTRLVLVPTYQNKDFQEVLFIRWVLTSNLDINGVELVESGKTKIDDIEIKGEVYTSLDQIGAEKSPVKIHYTADNQINFNSSILIKNVIQYDLSGKMLNEKMLSSFTGSFSCKQKQGISILVFQDYSGNRYAKKVMIQ